MEKSIFQLEYAINCSPRSRESLVALTILYVGLSSPGPRHAADLLPPTSDKAYAAGALLPSDVPRQKSMLCKRCRYTNSPPVIYGRTDEECRADSPYQRYQPSPPRLFCRSSSRWLPPLHQVAPSSTTIIAAAGAEG